MDQLEIVPYYGPLFVENVAHCLWRWLGPEGMARRRNSWDDLWPDSPNFWSQKLRRELQRPYGDATVFQRLGQLQPEFEKSRAGWLGGSFRRATFSAHSDLNLTAERHHPQDLPLPLLHHSLQESYWHSLRRRGFEISPRPRVVSLPGSRLPPGPFAQMARDRQTPTPYRRLARCLARRPLEWVQVPDGQPPARLFFAIAAWLGPHPSEPEAFLSWCEQRKPEIQSLLLRHGYQTHPVGRSLALLLGLQWIAQNQRRDSLHLLELGAAAGLHLNFARYAYHFQDGAQWGALDSPVQLNCPLPLPFPLRPLRLESRLGLDLRPLLRDDASWLLAQSQGRRSRSQLSLALQVAEQEPPAVVVGDACRDLPERLRHYPCDALVVVFHSHLFGQLNQTQQEELRGAIRRRPNTVELSLEWEDAIHPILRADSRRLAVYAKHRVYWLADESESPTQIRP